MVLLGFMSFILISDSNCHQRLMSYGDSVKERISACFKGETPYLSLQLQGKVTLFF